MAEWQAFTPGDMFPQEMEDILGPIADTADVLGTTLDLAADIVDLVALFVGGLSDINKALIEATQLLIASVTQALLGTGVFQLTHIPDSPALRVNPETWLSEVARSLDDPFDANKPILIDPGAYVGAVAVMAVGPDYRQLMSVFTKLWGMFQALVASLEQLTNMPLPGEDPPPVFPGTGRKPDWESVTVAKIVPAIGTIAEALQNFGRSIAAANDAGDIYGKFAAVLRLKATGLRISADLIEAALLNLTDALAFGGAYILPIYGQMDKAELQSQLLTSTGGPLLLGDAQFAAGFMWLAAGGTTTPRDVLFDLFGLAKENT